MNDLGTWTNVVTAIFTAFTAIFTAVAAGAAWQAASVAKATARDASRSASEQTKVSLTAAKANALASRIDFYTQQVTPIRKIIQDGKVMGPVVAKLVEEDKEYTAQQNHLAWWLDRQMDELKVGLRFECPDSRYNIHVPRWRGEQPTTGKG